LSDLQKSFFLGISILKTVSLSLTAGIPHSC